MKQTIIETVLEPEVVVDDDYAEGEIEILEPEEAYELEDNAPHLVFLISGIRTDGWWAQEVRQEGLLWDGRPVHFVPIRGNGGGIGRLSSLHLLSRFRIDEFRTHFVNQINDIATQRDYHSINVFAHSMGSALFADIVSHWPHELFKTKERIGTVVFLGSVCHRKHGAKLFKSAKLFVNHVGTRDYLPYLASLVRPDAYSDVGSWGFLDGYAHDRFYLHNHSSCTSFEHIRTEVLPLISSEEVKPLGAPNSPSGHYNIFVYLRWSAWFCFTLFVVWLL